MVRTGNGPVDYVADRVQVIGVSLSSSGDEVDRSEVLDPLAPPRASVVLGRRMASVTIEQEVYGDLSQHAALFRACPVEVTQSSAGIAGSVSSSPSARGKRCTIEIVEVGGNRYRIEDALGVFAMSGAPGERLMLTFDLQGELVPVEDAGLAPMAVVMPPAPLVYRNASLLASEQAFATCPEFSFDAGMTIGTTDYTCSPDGGRASFVQRDSQAVLALTGVLSGRESIDRHWAAARVPVCGATLDATVWSDGVSSSVRVELRECATVDPALAEVEGFAAYDLAVGAGAWSLVWDIDEGVPLPVQLGAVIWLDPSDASTLFVDADGTVPAVDGDPVGLWRNKGTLGATGDAKQAVSANRPVWSGGVVALESGQTMTTGHVAAMPFSSAVAWRRSPSMTATGHMITSGGAGGTARWNINSQAPTGATVQAIGPSGRTATIAVHEGVAYAAWSTSSLKTRTLGNQDENATTVAPFTPAATRIGFSYAGDVGHVLVFDRELTDTEATQLLTWMEAQS